MEKKYEISVKEVQGNFLCRLLGIKVHFFSLLALPTQPTSLFMSSDMKKLAL